MFEKIVGATENRRFSKAECAERVRWRSQKHIPQNFRVANNLNQSGIFVRRVLVSVKELQFDFCGFLQGWSEQSERNAVRVKNPPE
ncbi:hypothetical protein IKQ26_05445 [bacterium]|nr:hypothetical protein [bacterium]